MSVRTVRIGSWYARYPGPDDRPRPTIFDLMPNFSGVWCAATWDQHWGEICTRRAGHGLRHAAHDGNGYVIAVWSREESTS